MSEPDVRGSATDGATEGELRAIIAAQDKQLRTLTHRLKNNLQLVISLLSLRLSAVRDAAARREIEDALSKIHAVALVQKKLHDSGRALSVKFDEYLEELAAGLDHPGGTPALQTVPVTIGMERAVPLGLITNELLLHAGAKTARLTRGADGRATLALSGMAAPFAEQGGSFGRPLLEALVRQAQATLRTEGDVLCLSFEEG